MRKLGSRFRFRVSETFDIFDDIRLHYIAAVNWIHRFWKPFDFFGWRYDLVEPHISDFPILQLWKWNAFSLLLCIYNTKLGNKGRHWIHGFWIPLYWYFSKLKQRKWKALCWENGGFTHVWNFLREDRIWFQSPDFSGTAFYSLSISNKILSPFVIPNPICSDCQRKFGN